jgi:hypothetical protein
MRSFGSCLLLASLALVLVGCLGQPAPNYKGPKIDKFSGKVVADGKAVTFPDGQMTRIQVQHEEGTMWGIELKTDGSFNIGWMPVGKYTAFLERGAKGGKGQDRGGKMGIPDFEIKEGQTEYVIDLGKNFKG